MRTAAAIAGTTAWYLRSGRRRQLTWGASTAEAAKPLAGDDLIAAADLTATRAITVRVPPDRVWPWIAQLGQGRGGFYSYDRAENLAGCDIHSADAILPEHQHLQVGAQVRLTPGVGLAVARLHDGRSFVLRGAVPIGTAAPPYDFTWAFVLEDRRDGAARLLVRERYAYARWWARVLVEPTAVVSFAMSQKMLRGIKARAEGAGPRPAGPDRGR